MAGWKMSCCKIFVSQLARYPTRCIACHNQEERTYVLWHAIVLAVACHTMHYLHTHMYKNVFLHVPFWPVVTMRRKQACFLSSSLSQVRDEGFVSPNELTGCFV